MRHKIRLHCVKHYSDKNPSNRKNRTIFSPAAGAPNNPPPVAGAGAAGCAPKRDGAGAAGVAPPPKLKPPAAAGAGAEAPKLNAIIALEIDHGRVIYWCIGIVSDAD